MPNTIKLKKYLDVINEYDAEAAITPGMLIELTSSNTVQAHSTAGGNTGRMFALEDELQGNSISDAYAADDKVQCWCTTPGEEVYAILVDDSAAVSIGDFLESNGDGYLTKHETDTESFESAETGSISVYPEQIVGIALEALDLSGSSGEESSGYNSADVGYNRRIKIRIV